jgi:hypothetical protein
MRCPLPASRPAAWTPAACHVTSVTVICWRRDWLFSPVQEHFRPGLSNTAAFSLSGPRPRRDRQNPNPQDGRVRAHQAPITADPTFQTRPRGPEDAPIKPPLGYKALVAATTRPASSSPPSPRSLARSSRRQNGTRLSLLLPLTCSASSLCSAIEFEGILRNF